MGSNAFPKGDEDEASDAQTCKLLGGGHGGCWLELGNSGGLGDILLPPLLLLPLLLEGRVPFFVPFDRPLMMEERRGI